jgi:hypothetical protein
MPDLLKRIAALLTFGSENFGLRFVIYRKDRNENFKALVKGAVKVREGL